MSVKILVIEDDQGLVDLLTNVLVSHHYIVEAVDDGPPGLELATSFTYDLILLDLGLPTLDGVSLCQKLRSAAVTVPILLMTVEDTPSAKVQALDAGADDYLVKPIDTAELLARVRALLRRGEMQQPPRLTWGPLCLDPATCEVTCGAQPLHLTAKEYELLELFLRHPQQIFSPDQLIEKLWSLETTPTHNAIRARIKALRDKLHGLGVTPIETVHGRGYRLAASPGATTVAEMPVAVDAGLSPGLAVELAPIWERHRQEYFGHVALLEQAIVSINTQSYTQAMQQRSQRAAHTLRGTLGSFGLTFAGQLADEIEALLQTVSPINQADFTKLINRVVKLKHVLQQVAPPATLTTQLLIVHADQAIGKALAAEATLWGLSAETVATLAEAQAILTQLRPNLVLLDFVSLEQLSQTTEMLTRQAPPAVPIIALSDQVDLQTRVQLTKLGAVQLLQMPLSAAQIMTTVNQTLKQSLRYPVKLLVLDDDRTMLACLQHWLEPLGFELILLDYASDFWSTLEQTNPDIVILDIKMPDFSGIELCQAIRRDRTWQTLPVIFLSAYDDADTVQQVFAAGGDDLLHKPTSQPEVVTRLYNRLQRSHWCPNSNHEIGCLCI